MPKLLNQAVQKNQWLVIDGASQFDVSPRYVTIGEITKPVYVDGSNYRVRCPVELEPGTYEVLFEGMALGSVRVY